MIKVIGITNTRLNLREGPGSEYVVSRVLDKGARLEVLEDMGTWLNVLVDGSYGFVNENYVTLEEIDLAPHPPDLPDAVHGLLAKTSTRVNLREGPGEAYDIFVTLEEGTELLILEDHGKWLNVFYVDRLAYIDEAFVEIHDGGAALAEEDSVDSARSNGIETKARVRVSTALKASPDESSISVKALQPGDEVLVMEDLGAWIGVLHEDQEGYVHESEVKLIWKVIGYSITAQNLMSGPGETFHVLAEVPENAALEILEDLGEWLDVRYQEMHGYVRDSEVTFEDAGPGPEEQSVSDPVPAANRVESTPDWLVQLARNASAQYGPLLDDLVKQVGIEVEVAIAVAAVEFMQRGFNSDGRMMIRFENHIFWHYWGKRHPEEFDAHFKFSKDVYWQGHQYRTDEAGETWEDVHGRSQAGEWAAYKLAAEQNLEAARLSISMGAPQIMGFNYLQSGYQTVHNMFEDFQSSETAQLQGFIELVARDAANNEGLDALRQKDFLAFARYYHGAAKDDKYAALMHQVYDFITAN